MRVFKYAVGLPFFSASPGENLLYFGMASPDNHIW